MHKFASFNHEILPAKDIKLNAISSASLYGKGVFTTIAIYDSKPFLWDKHWSRLKDNAEKIGVDISNFEKANVGVSIAEITKKNEITNGRCRLTFFDESSSKIWRLSEQKRTSLLIQTDDERGIKQSLSVDVSAYPINSLSSLSAIKSCSYLENIIAFEEGKKSGFDEMIRKNERNEVVSFCLANIFWLEFDDERLYTPSLKTGCLSGTTRELVLENYDVVEIEKDIVELYEDAESIFLTSSAVGVRQVTVFDNRDLSNRKHAFLQIIDRVKNGF